MKTCPKFVSILSMFFIFPVFALALIISDVDADEAPAAVPDDSQQDGPMILPGHEGRQAQQVEASPFEASSARKRMKGLYADSLLFMPVPRLNEKGEIIPETDETAEITAEQRIQDFLKVEEWYTAAPSEMKGKLILVEFWATWCPPCRRSLKLLNHWAEKYGDKLIVISICETDRQAIDTMPGALKGKDLTHFVAIDTQRRCANALNVWGIPHAILIEPMYGAVVWEGMPNQPEYELTDAILDRIIAIANRSE